jgi:ketosteroid isomerase-like protein
MTERTTQEPNRGSLEAFFARYGEALSAGDLKGISSCYAVPAFVLSDAGGRPKATRAEIEADFDGAAECFRDQGLVAARPSVVASESLTEKLLSADVRWDYLDEDGRSAQQDGYRYALRLEEGAGPQICVVIATPSI